MRIHEPATLGEADRKWAQRFFHDEIFPVLTPLAVDASHPFPQVVNKSHNLIIRAHGRAAKASRSTRSCRCRARSRGLIRLPARTEEGAERYDYRLSQRAAEVSHRGVFFPG